MIDIVVGRLRTASFVSAGVLENCAIIDCVYLLTNLMLGESNVMGLASFAPRFGRMRGVVTGLVTAVTSVRSPGGGVYLNGISGLEGSGD